jgi:hypothetical protein
MEGGLTLTPLRLSGGVWEGVLAGGAIAPVLVVTHLGLAVEGVTVTEREPGQWMIRVPVPPAAIADGVQTVLITDAVTGARLGDITLIAGDALDGDLRAEISLLRAELDLLKRAFRRHCAETAGG